MSKKKKILFPVGTKVRIKASIAPPEKDVLYKSHPQDIGVEAYVVGYMKGKNFPYLLDKTPHSYWYGELEKVEEAAQEPTVDPESPRSYMFDPRSLHPLYEDDPDCEDCEHQTESAATDYPYGGESLEEYAIRTANKVGKLQEQTVSMSEIRAVIREEIAQHESVKEAEDMFRSILENITKPSKEDKQMDKPQTLRQKLRYAALPKDEKILRESGFYDSTGALTEQGRRIVVDTLWEGVSAADRKKVVEAVEATLPKEK